MENILSAVFTALMVSAFGAMGGALIALMIKKPDCKFSAALMGFSGGIIVTAIFEMLHESIEIAGVPPVLVGVAVGAFVLFLVTRLIPHADPADYGDDMIIEGLKGTGVSHADVIRTGKLLAVGVAIHNLPQGIAIGGAAGNFGFALAALLVLHNVPEAMAMAIPMKLGRVDNSKIIRIVLMTAIPTVVGAVIGAVVSGISPVFLGACVSFGAGAMAYLTIREMIPQALRLYKGPGTFAAMAVGIGMGLVVLWLTH